MQLEQESPRHTDIVFSCGQRGASKPVDEPEEEAERETGRAENSHLFHLPLEFVVRDASGEEMEDVGSDEMDHYAEGQGVEDGFVDG